MTGAELKAARNALGLSAEGFARVVGASDGRIVRRWERGDYLVPRSIEIITTLLLRFRVVRAALGVAEPTRTDTD